MIEVLALCCSGFWLGLLFVRRDWISTETQAQKLLIKALLIAGLFLILDSLAIAFGPIFFATVPDWFENIQLGLAIAACVMLVIPPLLYFAYWLENYIRKARQQA